MCYYPQRRIDNEPRGRTVSALVNFILRRMGELGKQQSEIADRSDLKRQTLNNILKKDVASGKKPVVPTPETIRKLAVGLEVPPSLLTFLLGYPVEPIPDVDPHVYDLALRLLGAPWVVDRMEDLLLLPEEEFLALMRWLDYQKGRSGGSGNQSTP